MATFSEISNLLQEIRDALDAIDGSPFGDIPKMLDKMADKADRAMAKVEELQVECAALAAAIAKAAP